MKKATLRRRIKDLERQVAILEPLLRQAWKKSAPTPGRARRFLRNLKSIVTGRGGIH